MSGLNNNVNPIKKITYETVPLVYNNDTDVSNINNILLIDSTVRDNNIFIDSCNVITFPIVYNRYSDRTELRYLLLNKFSLTQLSRIALVFHNSDMYSKKFLNNTDFFEYKDIRENPVIIDNVQFLIDLIKEFNIKNVDYLACNSLNHNNWNKYYDILKTNTTAVVGASDDETGNIKYGGDWLLENTSEDVKNIYFNENIENYTSTLATTIQINGGLSTNNNIYIKQLTNGNIYYSTTNNADDNISTGTWTQINTAVDWQVGISNTNSTPDETNRLTVKILTNMTLNNVNNSFLINSSYITLNGNNKTFTINNVTNWEGIVGNGIFRNNVIIQNFITTSTGSTTLITGGGYIIRKETCSYSDNSIVENCVNNCDLTSAMFGGGIVGQGSFESGFPITCIVRNCTNNGNNIGEGGGGICAYYCFNNPGTNTIQNCINNGSIQYSGSGILPSGLLQKV